MKASYVLTLFIEVTLRCVWITIENIFTLNRSVTRRFKKYTDNQHNLSITDLFRVTWLYSWVIPKFPSPLSIQKILWTIIFGQEKQQNYVEMLLISSFWRNTNTKIRIPPQFNAFSETCNYVFYLSPWDDSFIILQGCF